MIAQKSQGLRARSLNRQPSIDMPSQEGIVQPVPPCSILERCQEKKKYLQTQSEQEKSNNEDNNNIVPANFNEETVIPKYEPLQQLAMAHSAAAHSVKAAVIRIDSGDSSGQGDNEACLQNNLITETNLNTPISSKSKFGLQSTQKPTTFSLLYMVRAIYMLILIYTGCVLPIVVNIVNFTLPLQLACNMFQIIYVVFKIRGKGDKSWRINLKTYFRSWDCLEVIAIFPGSAFDSYFYKYGLFFLKLTRVVSLNEQFNYLLGNFVRTKQLNFWFLIVQLECLLMWAARVWVFVVTLYDNPSGWASLNCKTYSTSNCFVDAYYLILYTIMTVGFGDLNPILTSQRALLLVYMAGGVFLFSYYVAVISCFVQKSFYIQPNSEKQSIILAKIKKAIRPTRQSALLIKAVSKYIKKYKTIDLENEQHFDMIRMLPENLQDQMEKYFNQKLLGDLAFFRQISGFKVMELIQSMKELQYEPGELIVQQNQNSEDIFFIKYGRAAPMVSGQFNYSHNICFAYFQRHSSFGEYEVFPSIKRRRWSVICLSWCRLLTLSGHSLLPYFQKNEVDSKRFSKFVVESETRLQRLQKQIIIHYQKAHHQKARRTTEEVINMSDNSYQLSRSSIKTQQIHSPHEKMLPGHHLRCLKDALHILKSTQINLISEINRAESHLQN